MTNYGLFGLEFGTGDSDCRDAGRGGAHDVEQFGHLDPPAVYRGGVDAQHAQQPRVQTVTMTTDCPEIYVNGVLGATASGYATTYVLLEMSSAARNALISNGTNLIAVHCHQTGGGQNIDAGIAQRVPIADTSTVPSDATGFTWSLDETSGSTAAIFPAVGSQALARADLGAFGRLHGCLTFDGTSSYAKSAARSATTSAWGSGEDNPAGGPA